MVGLIAMPVLLFTFFPAPALELQPPVDSAWVSEYMATVNTARVANGSAPLHLNQSLSSFAAVRFQNASKHYDILNYGFHQDYASTFPNGTVIHEHLYYVQGMTASEFANFTRSNGKWNDLLPGNYTQYGYYIGTVTYYSVHGGCDQSGRPPSVTNETAFLLSRGCTYTLVPQHLFVLELGGANPPGNLSLLMNLGQSVRVQNASIIGNGSGVGQPAPALSFSLTDDERSGLIDLTVSLTPFLSNGFLDFYHEVTVVCKFDHPFDAAHPLLPGKTVLATCTRLPATGGPTYQMSLQGTFADKSSFTMQGVKVQ
jgi:hypothetical protein